MPQQHLDRLTSIDASFLHQEGPTSHMHIGGVLVFEGPPPEFEDYLDHVRGRLHLVPRYRQKLATPPLETGRPLWVDDPNFNLDYHVRHAALPSPGTEEQLFLLTSRIASQQLDRSKPLWESWLVEGLEDDRFALIFKTHHSLVDGVSGVDLATVLFDVEPRAPAPPTDLEPWQPQREPSPAELVAGRRSRRASRRPPSWPRARSPRRPVRRPRWARSAMPPRASARSSGRGSTRRRETPLNVEIGPHRRFAVVRQELAHYKEIKDALGGTVNDVVLTVVSGALARLAAFARGPDRGSGDARARPRVGPHHRPPGHARQPADGDARPAARVHPRPGRAAAVRAQGDGRPQGVKAGGRRRDARGGQQPGAAHDPRPGKPPELLHAAVQSARHQHPRAAAAAVRPRAQARGPVTRSPSCPRTTLSRWRSCPTTATSTSDCSATTTRSPTSTSSPKASRRRSTSCWRWRAARRSEPRGPGPPRTARPRRTASAIPSGGRARSCRPAHGRAKRGPAADMRAKRARGSRPDRKRRSDT